MPPLEHDGDVAVLYGLFVHCGNAALLSYAHQPLDHDDDDGDADYDEDLDRGDHDDDVAVLYDPLLHCGNAALLSHRTKTSLRCPKKVQCHHHRHQCHDYCAGLYQRTLSAQFYLSHILRLSTGDCNGESCDPE